MNFYCLSGRECLFPGEQYCSRRRSQGIACARAVLPGIREILQAMCTYSFDVLHRWCPKENKR